MCYEIVRELEVHALQWLALSTFSVFTEEYPTSPLSIMAGENLFGEQDDSPLLLGGPGDDVKVTWNTGAMDTITGGAGTDTIDVVMAEYKEGSVLPVKEQVLVEGAPNTGSLSVKLPESTLEFSAGDFIFEDELHGAAIKIGRGLADSIRKTGQTTPAPILNSGISGDSTLSSAPLSQILTSSRFVHQRKPITAQSADELCSKWSRSEPNPNWTGNLPDCPINRGQLAAEESLWIRDPFCNELDTRTQINCCCKLFQPGARHCVKRRCVPKLPS